MQVSMSNQKSTESAIKNLEVQVRQLAMQLVDRSSSSFTANTEKNPKEECKVVMTRRKREIHVDESETEKKMEEHKQQLAPKPALEPVSDFVELEEINEETEDDKEEETPIK
ncbi:troponin I 1-like [Glycine soja]|uniref:troponin I 1-like n=1 Tax=Glycine max TaxID=3847 RepID=UPI0007192229|nr:troponin I 1-like [Glycine max]XP_028246735.1 troponin I 1-like [Glycine soja]|eukprot:XP_014633947.1 troponin I 1-like [Glycine max]